MKKYRDFIEFLVDDGRRRWLVQDYKDYLKTLNPHEALKYERDFMDWIRKKGVKSEDKVIIASIYKIPKNLQFMAGDIVGVIPPVPYNDRIKLEDFSQRFAKEFIKNPRKGFSFEYIKSWMYMKDAEQLTVNKEELKDDIKPLEVCIRFREYFQYSLPNYSHDKAAMFIYKNLKIEVELKSIRSYIGHEGYY